MTATPHLGIIELEAAQAEADVTVNEALRSLEAFSAFVVVISTNLHSPPASNDGDRYIVNPSGAGSWTGQSNKVALRRGGEWVFFTPVEGWVAYDQNQSTLLHFSQGSWRPLVIEEVTILTNLKVPIYTDQTRPSAGQLGAGSVIFNSDDNSLNVSSGGDWRAMDGTIT